MTELALMINKYGQKIWIEPNNHIAEAIQEKGVYDENTIHYIEAILEQLDHPVVLDIGAHVGNHALVMAQFSSMVYCFEPMPQTVAILQRNIEDNQIRNMQVFNIGLSDQNQTLPFYNDGFTFVSDLQQQGSAVQSLVCCVGDDVLAQHQISQVDFIKIDIEGFEGRALYGLRKTIEKSRPVVVMEWNNDHTREQFEKYDLFGTVFVDYEVRAISHNHHPSYFGRHWYSKLMRFFYRKFTAKSRELIPFYPEMDYSNIVLFPSEKAWVGEIQ